jgi:predicted Zn-dependent protease
MVRRKPMEGCRSARRWGRAIRLAAATVLLLAGWGAWRLWEVRRHRRGLAEARAEMQAGRYGHAARTLLDLAAGGPGRDEAEYLLGVCEKARGHDPAATEAWARVPPDSPFAARAIQGLMELEIQRGRLSDAERLVERALDDPRIDAAALRIFLGMIYSLEGRVEDGERLVESTWRRLDHAGLGASERAIQLARLHVALRQEAASIDSIRSYLDHAARMEPDDDRVRLGRDNLAIRTGAFDEAARWLDDCLRSRPDDLAVWRARLDWAVASGRVDEARAAMARLPASEATESQIRRLAAWLAARRGDARAEKQALERLLAVAPADRAALDRLAGLAREQREPGRAAVWEHRKAEVEALQSRFQELYRRNQPLRDAAELARIAGRLGRSFEARAFLTVAVAADPDRADLRAELDLFNRSDRQRDAAAAEPGRSLAEVLESELAADHAPGP